MEKTMEKIVALAKARGFVYPGSEIYGGLANTWDYGNLGVELKNNVKKAWWQKFVQESPYNVGVDCAILMNPQTTSFSSAVACMGNVGPGFGMVGSLGNYSDLPAVMKFSNTMLMLLGRLEIFGLVQLFFLKWWR